MRSGIDSAGHTSRVFSARRVLAVMRRYLYLLLGSWPRLLELAYWPTVQMILWGFMTLFLAQQTEYVAQAFGVLLSAVLLWDVLFRSQIGLAVCFMEEMWSRNIGHLFVSPLRIYELICSLLLISFLRVVIGLIPATLLAMLFFDYSVYELGLPLAGFFASLLMMGWSVGLAVSGLVLRFGMGAESLAWVMVFALAPVSGVWYPIRVLPEWLQHVSWCLPSAYVFEGMRAILVEGAFRSDLMLGALALNGVYMLLGAAAFVAFFELARRDGQLLNTGE